MPKISDQRRAERRMQILNAAWTCFQREGLHATTMDDIITASGLSAGAVYGYFKGKEDIIFAAVTHSLTGIRALFGQLLLQQPLPAPDEFLRGVAQRIDQFTVRQGFDLRRLALLGWSESQRNPRLRATMRSFYLEFRSRLAELAGAWRKSGLVEGPGSADDTAKAVLALIVGYVVQSALLGDVAPAELGRGAVQLRAMPGEKKRGRGSPA